MVNMRPKGIAIAGRLVSGIKIELKMLFSGCIGTGVIDRIPWF